MKVVIALATYNAGGFLEAQLQSIVAQTVTEWSLLVSDDGSTDQTGEALRAFCSREERGRLLAHRNGARGACHNFEYLLAAAAEEVGPADAIFLCDQDDIWRPSKIQLQCRQLQSAMGCYSDALLIDEEGAELPGSFLSQTAAPSGGGMTELLSQNFVLGCSLALRADVLSLALPFPPRLLNHDWWLALCCLAAGTLERVSKPLLHYRQHAGNVVGSYRPARQFRKLPRLHTRQREVLESQVEATAVLAGRLADRGQRVPPELEAYRCALSGGALSRSRSMLAGPFAARHVPLRWLRASAALSMRVRDHPRTP